ncbi:nitrous oxide reductase accessory protein NosL [bacterium endosymbiont of Escarpia laminata]|nr:MAG: nitrous oxide reductase accessory protein NosL [bacterium endosymbiont of Escarpia laminata]RLJ21343.1 MAG: nitrous oxide reductase accessory protein NosL [bacterium endosymbiont of Escarpia laminata]
MNTGNKFLLIFFMVLILLVRPVFSEPVDLPKPGPTDTCPVCGMFVAKYPEWVATVRYKDGHAHHFDGAKDLFKYLLDLPKWAPGHQAESIDAIGATEYYGLILIDARQAFYVTGSDVLGPMGHELIPLETKEDAEEFLRDHKGSGIIRFNQVTGEILMKLDNGLFE